MAAAGERFQRVERVTWAWPLSRTGSIGPIGLSLTACQFDETATTR